MLFSSPLFLFFFMPLFAVAYGLAPRRMKNAVILLGSLFFYAWSEPRFIGVVLLSSLLDWVCARSLFASTSRAARLSWMWLGICGNLGLLFYFKYANFFLSSAGPLLAAAHIPQPVLNLYLPIGVSFIVFEKITYVVDVYKGLGKPAPNFFSYLVYVFLFPKLLAGPIIKYHDIEGQLSERKESLHDVEAGFLRFLSGLAKKVLLADCLATVADNVFSVGGAGCGTFYAWIGVLCFTLQIYFDFSGYSDMAIGMARMMGFQLRENFNLPYIATSFTDFWHRWHLSLSSWIREYLYIPLGGSRVGPLHRYANLWACFLLSGLWHGASWTFVFWGFYHGLGLVADKLAWLKVEPKVPRPLAAAATLLLVVIGWVFFRAETFTKATEMLHAMFCYSPPRQFIYIGNDIVFVFAIATLFCFIRPSDLFIRVARDTVRWVRMPTLRLARTTAIMVTLLVCLARASASSFHPFLYFRF